MQTIETPLHAGESGMGKMAQGSLAREGWLHLDICASLRILSYATADGTGLPT